MVTGMQCSIKLLGPLAIRRVADETLPLPASRKVRALIAYLALSPRPVSRAHLCEMLWEIPNDPRGELRWCLSKVRGLLDEPEHKRVQTSGELISLDLAGCFVDVQEITNAMQAGIAQLPAQRLCELAALFSGEFLETLELERCPQFEGWLVAQRRRLRACHMAILEQLVHTLPAGSPEVFAVLERWLEHSPLDRRGHEMLFEAFARGGRVREGAEHLDAAARLFEAEGLDVSPLREAWQAALNAHRIVSIQSLDASSPLVLPGAAQSTRRASIAVMPLTDVSVVRNTAAGAAAASGRSEAHGMAHDMAGSLVHDVITRLAKLRSIAVIAQGTVFALAARGVGADAAGRMLNVDYVASGSLRRHGRRLTVMMELTETRSAHIVWAEDFDSPLDDALLVLDEMGNRIVAAIANEIETAERKRARLKPPSSLDAWEAYHRGLWHMYRFDASDNDQAQHFFQQSVRLDPTFSRAHAGLSFTHFQNAFLHRISDRDREVERALATAEQGLMIDERDPAAHWAMGRALWLKNRQDESLTALGRAVELSPNFALGHYTLAFVHSQSGDPRAAIVSSDHSRHLSPFDPLLFAMMASRALAHVRLGQADEAAVWASNAAKRPNAHVHVKAIAAHCLAAAERIDEAQALMATIHRTHRNYGIGDFLTAFRFDVETQVMFRGLARRIGIG